MNNLLCTEMKLIPLTKGKVAKVDDTDFDTFGKFKWHITTGDYAGRNKKAPNGKFTIVTLHREIMNPPPGMEVDHINGDRLDNQRSNLRIVTPRENQWNTRANKAGISGITGVHLRNGLWAFRITGNGYRTKEEAAQARNAGVEAIRGKFAILHEAPSCARGVE